MRQGRDTDVSMSKGWTQQPEEKSDRQVLVRSKSGNPDSMVAAYGGNDCD